MAYETRVDDWVKQQLEAEGLDWYEQRDMPQNYKDAQRDEAIRTVKKNLPLNVMYWAKVVDEKIKILKEGI